MKGSLCRLAETSFLWRDTAMRIRERFNPRAPCGARLPPRQAPSSMPYFNPCAPCGARRRRFGVARAAAGFQPTRPLRGATFLGAGFLRIILNFNPRAPCGARPILVALGVYKFVFQPTRPLRGATRSRIEFTINKWNFNPRAPCGARPMKNVSPNQSIIISTHAPLAGRDLLRP